MTTKIMAVANARSLHPNEKDSLRRLLVDRLGRPLDFMITERPDHATALTRRALQDGYDVIVAIGGDGSINEVVNGFFEGNTPVRPEAVLGIVPHGTGNDLARTLRIPKDPAQAARILRADRRKVVDLGLARFSSLDGETRQRFFINIAEFGAGGLAVSNLRLAPKIFNARWKFLWAILMASLQYRNQPLRYTIDDQAPVAVVVSNFVVANGQFFGAGLRPAPMAEMDDGRLDVVCFGDFGQWEMARRFRRLRKGTHLGHPKIFHGRAVKVSATAETAVLLELDGDLVGRLPASFEIIPKTLQVCVP
ncbi:MAG: diacylglycerol kinase family lipid kinase [Acidobacteria bacterium]|nr:diacylglycerol kinase family lipid kinase [Acidobacteriota bacterium]MBI3658545.1 diacylglycerol kinase family lipid kinase [Acidobacteriota bacterium]